MNPNCRRAQNKKRQKRLSEGRTLSYEVISKAIRDAPWPKTYSKPLNSKENGGLIPHSTKLKTGVLQLASEISPAAVFPRSSVVYFDQHPFRNSLIHLDTFWSAYMD